MLMSSAHRRRRTSTFFLSGGGAEFVRILSAGQKALDRASQCDAARSVTVKNRTVLRLLIAEYKVTHQPCSHSRGKFSKWVVGQQQAFVFLTPRYCVKIIFSMYRDETQEDVSDW